MLRNASDWRTEHVLHILVQCYILRPAVEIIHKVVIMLKIIDVEI